MFIFISKLLNHFIQLINLQCVLSYVYNKLTTTSHFSYCKKSKINNKNKL